MVSAVKSRPSHYEVLELTPAASEDDIARAFARKMSVAGFHSVGEAAQILVAYETLRDADRRREYDRSLAPPPKPETRQWTAAVQPRWSPFIASPAVQALQAATADPRPSPEPHVTMAPDPDPEPEPDPGAKAAVDPRLASIAATVRELSRPAAEEQPLAPRPAAQQQRKADESLEPLIQHILEVGRAEKARLRDTGNSGFDWRRPALAAGGLLLGAGLFGTLVGLSVKDTVEAAASSQPDEAAQRRAPPRQAEAVPARPPASPSAAMEAPVEHARVEVIASTPKHSASQPRPTSWAEQAAAQLKSGEVEAANEEATAEPVQSVAAAMPLPNGFVARTIERIGYSCGDVASTMRVDGEGRGVFKVTCTSGQSYRAAPVRGRYHFRRWSSR